MSIPDLPMPVLPPGGGIKDSPGVGWEPLPGHHTAITDNMVTVFPVLAFLAVVLVLFFLLNQLYKIRGKPRRKRPRLKKIHHMVYGKVPSV